MHRFIPGFLPRRIHMDALLRDFSYGMQGKFLKIFLDRKTSQPRKHEQNHGFETRPVSQPARRYPLGFTFYLADPSARFTYITNQPRSALGVRRPGASFRSQVLIGLKRALTTNGHQSTRITKGVGTTDCTDITDTVSSLVIRASSFSIIRVIRSCLSLRPPRPLR